MTQAKFHYGAARTVLVCGIALAVLAWAPGRAGADPPTLTDRELDAVSARGFSFGALSFGRQPSATTVTPVATTTGLNSTSVKNIVFGLTNTVNVNTAVNTCVFATCENSGANIESNPTNQNQIDLTNDINPTVSNGVSLPVITNSFVPSGPGNLPALSSTGLSGGPPVTAQGVPKVRPPLPQVSWGIK